MPPPALPKGWLPAIKFFIGLTPDQLIEKGLPSNNETLRNYLKYIYSDGHGFVYCTGQFLHPDVVTRCVDPPCFSPQRPWLLLQYVVRLLMIASQCCMTVLSVEGSTGLCPSATTDWHFAGLALPTTIGVMRTNMALACIAA